MNPDNGMAIKMVFLVHWIVPTNRGIAQGNLQSSGMITADRLPILREKIAESLRERNPGIEFDVAAVTIANIMPMAERLPEKSNIVTPRRF